LLTACGIAQEDQSRIFEAFVQIGAQGKRQGTGLGLAITRQFVELMGGELSLSSVLGNGSTFRVALVVTQPQPEAIPQVIRERGEVIRLAPGQPIYRMLVVEDQPDNQLMLVRLLESVGFQVDVADNGAEAVERFASMRPHFIWMDRFMPVMDGLEATRRIRAIAGGKEVKIAALTATVLSEQDERLVEAGFDAIVHKPFKPERVFGCMEQLLGLSFERSETDGNPVAPSELSPTAMAALPPALRQDLKNALVMMNRERILEVLEGVEQIERELGAALKSRVQNYDYAPILALLQNGRSDDREG
jgi:CheY-like chemotaxis protein